MTSSTIKLWHAERDEIHQQDLETRRHEQEQKQEVKILQKTRQSISSELDMSILNSESAWKTDQEELKKLFSSQLYENDEKEIEIIVDTADDKSLLQDSIALQHDYIALSEDSENLSDSSDSSDSSSEKSVYSM